MVVAVHVLLPVTVALSVRHPAKPRHVGRVLALRLGHGDDSDVDRQGQKADQTNQHQTNTAGSHHGGGVWKSCAFSIPNHVETGFADVFSFNFLRWP